MKGEEEHTMLKENLWGVFALAQANDKDALTGIDLLVHNLENQDGPVFYEGASQLDYPVLAAAWEMLSGEEKAGEKNEARALLLARYDRLTAAWREQDREAFEAALAR